ncbi:MAG: hypothetical protein NVS4B2_22830 [Chloroflexota bacterium]
MFVPGDFERRAPYAPISALREFFDRIRDIAVPARVDRRFLQKLNVASNNEWALLSALKFLEIVDDRGAPTHAYRQLQTTDKARGTLRHLVETAYAPLLQVGGAGMSIDDLRNYFRVSSSASQAKNAARFFREICDMAGVQGSETGTQALPETYVPVEAPAIAAAPPTATPRGTGLPAAGADDLLLMTKAALLEKLPPLRPEWTAEEYTTLCDRFLQMLRNLEQSD